MKISTKEMTLVAMFTGLTAIGAFISLPIGEVPISMQSLFVILAGLILGSKLAALSQILYIILGLIGLPIFAGFTGGLSSIMKPSFGFIIGFVFAAYIVGKLTELNKDKKMIYIASFIGTFVIYLFGLPYMYYMINIIMVKGLSLFTVLKIGCIIFLPGDILKALVSSLVATQTIPILRKSRLI